MPTLTAGAGSYTIFGGPIRSVTFHVSVAYPSGAGSYSITGSAAKFMPSITDASAAYVVTGGSAASIDKLAAVAGHYSISGKAAPIGASGKLTITGYPATLTRNYVNWFPIAPPTSTWTTDANQTIPPPASD